MWSTFHLGHWHPLTWMTLAADYALWGMNPLGYHLTTLLFHSANAALLALLLRRLLRLAGRPDLAWPAAVGALAYSLHPLRVESVAWVTERRDVLCGFFSLLSVLAYLERVERERQGRPGGRWLALSVAAFGASLLSKALSITLPAVLLILDVVPLRRAAAGSYGKLLREKIPYGILSCADAAIMVLAMRHIDAVHRVAGYHLMERAAQAAYGLCFYPMKFLWPHPLLPIYPIQVPMRPAEPRYLLAMATVVVVTAALVALRRRAPGLLAAWGSYAILVLPVLGVAVSGMQIAADRYTYLSLLPVSALLAEACHRWTLPGRRLALRTVAAAWLLGLAALSWHQCRYWADSLSLWDHELRYEPDLYFPRFSRACVRMGLGDRQGALEDFNASLALNPYWEMTWVWRCNLRAVQGDHPGALADFTQALQLEPRSVEAYTGRATSRAKLGDVSGALSDCDLAIRLRPGTSLAYATRGNILLDRGDYPGAVASYDRSLQNNPFAPEVFRNRGLAKLRGGRAREAVEDFTRSLELRPDDVDCRIDRGVARSMAGDLDGGLEDLTRALGGSGNPRILVRRAVVRVLKGDLDGAMGDLDQAIRLDPGLPEAYTRRGMIQLQQGRSEEAARDLEKALSVAPPNWPLLRQTRELLLQARSK